MASYPLPAPTQKKAAPPAEPGTLSDSLDRALHNWQSRYTGGRSPSTVPLAFMDWAADTANAPFKTAALAHTALAQWRRLAGAMAGGEPVALNDLHLPIFLVGTERDHIAPWHSVFKLHLNTDAELTFVLTSGGHNAGIVSEPGDPHRHFRIRTRTVGAPTPSADAGQRDTPEQEGSWWVEWAAWLDAHGSKKRIAPPPMGAALDPAPGRYVLER